MTQMRVLMKNQLKEGSRSFKLWIILFIFVFLGILSPATAKMLPMIMESVLPKEAQFQIPAITQLDSWQQFFKNVGQMGLIVFLILFLQLFWEDIQNGSLILFLTKGLNRATVIFSKWIYTCLVWTGIYLSAFGITAVYTFTLFKAAEIEHLGLSVFCLWLFGVFLFTSAFFVTMLMGSLVGGLIGAGLFWLTGIILELFPKTKQYSPTTLMSQNFAMLTHPQIAAKSWISISMTILLIILMVGLTIRMFQKKEF